VQSEELVTLVADALNELKARNVCVLNVGELTSITSHMVIASGTSSRHVRAIANSVVERSKAAGYVPLGIEGQDFGEWVLIDLDDVVVHVMQVKARDFYKLENLWNMETQSGTAKGPTLVEPGG
jgi:ribosome-associated protein